jgi:hypothetical protein
MSPSPTVRPAKGRTVLVIDALAAHAPAIKRLAAYHPGDIARHEIGQIAAPFGQVFAAVLLRVLFKRRAR